MRFSPGNRGEIALEHHAKGGISENSGGFLSRRFCQPKLVLPLVSSSSDCIPTIQSVANGSAARIRQFPGDLAALRLGRIVSTGGQRLFGGVFLSGQNAQPKV